MLVVGTNVAAVVYVSVRELKVPDVVADVNRLWLEDDNGKFDGDLSKP